MKRYLVLVLACTMILGNLAIPTSANTTPEVAYHYNYNFEGGELPIPDWETVPAKVQGADPTWVGATIVEGKTAFATGTVIQAKPVPGFIPIHSTRIINQDGYSGSTSHYSIVEFDFMFDETATTGNTELMLMQRAANENNHSIVQFVFDAEARTFTANVKDGPTQANVTKTLLENVQPNSWHRIRVDIMPPNNKRLNFYVDGVKDSTLYRFLGDDGRACVLDTIKIGGTAPWNPVYIDNLVSHKITQDSSRPTLLNKGVLVRQIRLADEIDTAEYTQASVTAFESALEVAKLAYTQNTSFDPPLKSEQDAVDSAANVLKTAMENLTTEDIEDPEVPLRDLRVNEGFEDGEIPEGWTINSIVNNSKFGTGKVAKLVGGNMIPLPPESFLTPANVGIGTEPRATRAQTVEFDLMFETKNDGETSFNFGQQFNNEGSYLTQIIYNRNNLGKLEAFCRQADAVGGGYPEEYIELVDNVELGKWYRVKVFFILSHGPSAPGKRIVFYTDGVQKSDDKRPISESEARADILDSIKVSANNSAYIDNFVVYVGYKEGVNYINKGALVSAIRNADQEKATLAAGVGSLEYVVPSIDTTLSSAKALYENSEVSQGDINSLTTTLKENISTLAPVRFRAIEQDQPIVFKDQSGNIVTDLADTDTLNFEIGIVSSENVSESNPAKAVALVSLYDSNNIVKAVAMSEQKEITTPNTEDIITLDMDKAMDLSEFTNREDMYIRVFIFQNAINLSPICNSTTWYSINSN